MADVKYEQATRIYPGTDAPAVDGLDLHVGDGELMVLVGPSGSGKTTALRMLAGLEEVDAGSVYIGGRDVTDLAPKKRDVAMVFQNYALYPYLTVAANIGFPLKIAKVKKAERERRVHEVAKLLGLDEPVHAADRERRDLARRGVDPGAERERPPRPGRGVATRVSGARFGRPAGPRRGRRGARRRLLRLLHGRDRGQADAARRPG